MGRGIALACLGGNLITLVQGGVVHVKLMPKLISLGPKKRYA
jgi:hypothetical protein